MADVDVTAKVVECKLNNALYSFGTTKIYKFDPVEMGAAEAGTHTLVNLDKGEMILDGQLIVGTTCTSGGSATVKLQIGSVDLTGALAVANLTKGTVVPLALSATGATKISDSAVNPVKAVIAVAALTAGDVYVVLRTCKLVDMA